MVTDKHFLEYDKQVIHPALREVKEAYDELKHKEKPELKRVAQILKHVDSELRKMSFDPEAGQKAQEVAESIRQLAQALKEDVRRAEMHAESITDKLEPLERELARARKRSKRR